ncbi:hypothetical protein IJJ08_03675 [bacterium]|nr:hypothetical protein [bacterium]
MKANGLVFLKRLCYNDYYGKKQNHLQKENYPWDEKTALPTKQKTIPAGVLVVVSIGIIVVIVWLLGTYTRDYLDHDAQVRERKAALERARY